MLIYLAMQSLDRKGKLLKLKCTIKQVPIYIYTFTFKTKFTVIFQNWNDFNNCKRMAPISIKRIFTSSSHPSIFWLVGRFPTGIVAGHSIQYSISVRSCVSGALF